MNLGGQTVTVLSYADSGEPNALGITEQVETTTDVPGCRHRPLSVRESAQYETNVATETWKTTTPPHPAVLGLTAGDAIRVDGVTYQLLGGPQPFTDLGGHLVKVTLITERQTG